MERLHMIVRGEVQGVGYRMFIQDAARRLGLHGWVRNNDDGAVELVAEGDRASLEALREAAGRGPRLARVRGVDTEWTAATAAWAAFELW